MSRIAPHRAFTLIEVMLVVIILALLTGGVALSFTGSLNQARMNQAIEQVRYIDASTRDLARRLNRPFELRIDLSEGTILRRERRGGEQSFVTNLPNPIRINAVWTAGRRLESGEMTLPISPLGLSQSYAIKLSSPQGARWIMIAGLGGDVTLLNDDAQVQAILAQASPRRDAD